MKFDYTNTRAAVQRLLQRFGDEATITHYGTSVYDPNTGLSTATETTQPIVAAVFPYEDKFIDGTLILSGDRQAFVSASGVTEPQPGSKVTWQSVAYTIVKSKNLGPAGVMVMYELQLRLM